MLGWKSGAESLVRETVEVENQGRYRELTEGVTGVLWEKKIKGEL